jgi:hypothetical protein
VYNLADKNAVRCEGGGHIAGAAVVAGGLFHSQCRRRGRKQSRSRRFMFFGACPDSKQLLCRSEREELFIKIQSTNRRGGPKAKLLPQLWKLISFFCFCVLFVCARALQSCIRVVKERGSAN